MKRQNLINKRKSLKLTQNEVANALGMRTTSYQNIEYGNRNTTTEKWSKLKDILNAPSIDFLLEQEDAHSLTQRTA